MPLKHFGNPSKMGIRFGFNEGALLFGVWLLWNVLSKEGRDAGDGGSCFTVNCTPRCFSIFRASKDQFGFI